MKKIISVINQKGGVGKSTTVLAIGHGLIRNGAKVLFIDLDAQCNLSYTLGIKDASASVLELLTLKSGTKQVIHNLGKGDLIPGNPSLSGADTLITTVGKEYRLKEALENVKKNYDYIVIDTPPALGILTINALVVSEEVIVPAQADVYSLQGINHLHSTIEVVKKYCNPSLEITGVLLTRFNPRSILTKDITKIIEGTAKQINTKVFKTRIREAIAIKEAQAKQQDIYSYAPKSGAASDYNDLLKELFKGNKG